MMDEIQETGGIKKVRSMHRGGEEARHEPRGKPDEKDIEKRRCSGATHRRFLAQAWDLFIENTLGISQKA